MERLPPLSWIQNIPADLYWCQETVIITLKGIWKIIKATEFKNQKTVAFSLDDV